MILAVVLFLIGMCFNRIRDGEWIYVGYYNIFIGLLTTVCVFLICAIGVSFYVIGNYIISI